MEAPERIWTYGHGYVAYNSPDVVITKESPARAEYIRADIAQSRLAAAEKRIERMTAELERCRDLMADQEDIDSIDQALAEQKGTEDG